MSKNNSSLGILNILKILSKGEGNIHFSGVGGVGMCSLFCLAKRFGFRVSGSDMQRGEFVEKLILAGAPITVGVRDKLPEDTVLLVYSLAIDERDSEILLAEERGIPVASRAEFLGAIMNCYGVRVGVSGTHGKSTVTAMLGKIFSEAKKCPTVICGAKLSGSELPFEIGALDYFIYEGCEYKDSFLHFSPDVAVFLNMELDHPDYFPTLTHLEASFGKAMRRASDIIVNKDDAALSALALKEKTSVVTFGRAKDAIYRYEPLPAEKGKLRMRIYRENEPLGEIELTLIGEFNLSNAAAAVATAMECGIEFEVISSALSSFRAIARRLERVGSFDGRAVYYDYAHHPSEIREGIRAVRDIEGGEVTVIFGPHTYSRTQALWDGFVSALSEADGVILTEISGIREGAIAGVTSEALAGKIGCDVVAHETDIVGKLRKTKGSVIIMGAADMEKIKREVLGI